MGFAVSFDGASVLLLEKGRPAALKGKWIGVGGHIEPGETPHDAIVRESKEEADIDVPTWESLGVVERENGTINMYAAFVDLASAKTMTDEQVKVFTWDEVARLGLSDATEEILDRVKIFAARGPRPVSSLRP
jgi:8-oxo-dGTP pyrophosphatase MutT (NUDIX family)